MGDINIDFLKYKTNDKTSVYVDNIYTDNDKIISDQTTITNAFNKYFSSIGTAKAKHIPPSNKNFRDYMERPITNSIFLEPVDEAHILDIVKSLKPKVSTGKDDISCKLLKETIAHITQPITHIMNISLDTGIFPEYSQN